MPIVISNNLVLAETGVLGADNPVIGWQNIVLTTNISSITADADFPVTNLANPATNYEWVGGVNAGDEAVKVITNSVEDIDYLAVAKPNFGSANIVTSVEGALGTDTAQKVLLHLNGDDATTTITDSNVGGSAHTWTAAGNAQIDTAQSVFGGGSLLCDGSGDWVSAPDHADFTLGSGALTVECRVRPAVNGTALEICGQGNSTGTAATTSFRIERIGAGNFIQALVSDGSAFTTLTGATTPIVTGSFYNIKLVRTGNVLSLLVNGLLEATAAFTGAVNNSANDFRVGAAGEITANTWNGWIEEFRLLVGRADDSAPPSLPYDQYAWFELVQEVQLADDAPVLFRFEPQPLTAIRLHTQPGDEAPRAAVMYVGKLLILPRTLWQGHTPIKYGRKRKVVNGTSESGNFLGRTVLNETRESTAHLSLIDPDTYREDIDPFIDASLENPFFFAWRPEMYPREVGYAWLTADPRPVNASQHGLTELDLVMQGVV
jgi:hypothetical protein